MDKDFFTFYIMNHPTSFQSKLSNVSLRADLKLLRLSNFIQKNSSNEFNKKPAKGLKTVSMEF